MTVMADSDITVAVATHKAYRMPIDGVYMPLQVGRALHPNVDLGMTCDNTGDNISQLNAQYSELTGLYWMWKNCDADYQGLVHYRRHFAKNDSAKRHGDENERFSCIAGKQDYARLLDTCEIIVPERRNYYIETVYSHYEHTMQEGQLDATRSIIAQTNSDYLDAFDAQMNKTSAHLFNMFVMRKDLINECFPSSENWPSISIQAHTASSKCDFPDASAKSSSMYGWKPTITRTSKCLSSAPNQWTGSKRGPVSLWRNS